MTYVSGTSGYSRYCTLKMTADAVDAVAETRRQKILPRLTLGDSQLERARVSESEVRVFLVGQARNPTSRKPRPRDWRRGVFPLCLFAE